MLRSFLSLLDHSSVPELMEESWGRTQGQLRSS